MRVGSDLFELISCASRLPVSFSSTEHDSRYVNSHSYGEERYSANHHSEPNPLIAGQKHETIKIKIKIPNPEKMTHTKEERKTSNLTRRYFSLHFLDKTYPIGRVSRKLPPITIPSHANRNSCPQTNSSSDTSSTLKMCNSENLTLPLRRIFQRELF